MILRATVRAEDIHPAKDPFLGDIFCQPFPVPTGEQKPLPLVTSALGLQLFQSLFKMLFPPQFDPDMKDAGGRPFSSGGHKDFSSLLPAFARPTGMKPAPLGWPHAASRCQLPVSPGLAQVPAVPTGALQRFSSGLAHPACFQGGKPGLGSHHHHGLGAGVALSRGTGSTGVPELEAGDFFLAGWGYGSLLTPWPVAKWHGWVAASARINSCQLAV